MKKASEWNKRYRAKHPERMLAHSIVNNEIRRGRMKRMPCESCGEIKSHAHHDDYSKPLIVRWLCQKCHSIQHHGPLDQRVTKRRARQTPYKRRKPYATLVYPRHIFLSRAVELRAAGMTYSAVATSLGVTKGTIYKWVNNTPYE